MLPWPLDPTQLRAQVREYPSYCKRMHGTDIPELWTEISFPSKLRFKIAVDMTWQSDTRILYSSHRATAVTVISPRIKSEVSAVRLCNPIGPTLRPRSTSKCANYRLSQCSSKQCLRASWPAVQKLADFSTFRDPRNYRTKSLSVLFWWMRTQTKGSLTLLSRWF